MELSIKEELIACLRNLDVPEIKKAKIEHTIKTLEGRTIDNTPEGKLVAGSLLNLLSELIPELLNSKKNKEAVAKLEEKLNNIVIAEITSPRVSRKK